MIIKELKELLNKYDDNLKVLRMDCEYGNAPITYIEEEITEDNKTYKLKGERVIILCS